MDSKIFDIDLGWEGEIEVEIFFDFCPPEPMTRHYPGYDDYVDICEVRRVDNNAELRLMKEEEEHFTERIWYEWHDSRFDTAYDVRGY